MRLFLLIIPALILSCAQKLDIKSNLGQEHLIPYPLAIESSDSSFDLSVNKTIYTSNDNELKSLGNLLKSELKEVSSLDFNIENSTELKNSGIQISISKLSSSNHKEAYELSINENSIQLKGNTAEGVFRGIQTLLQLIPSTSITTTAVDKSFYIATGNIKDAPRFEYRGAMLDVCRHFFGVDEVKEYIDQIAAYKINKLHMHLTDDQGWRIEIKSWPNLTKIGAKTQVGGGESGYYTQAQFKDIIAYAATKYIEVIPEIDMPGHTNAALTSYPELNCDNKATKPYTGMKVGFSSLCINKDVTYKFIDDVVREIASISPSQYIHIGGDESKATKFDEYVIFIKKAIQTVEKYNKTAIGWDEIAQTNIEPSTVVQFWNGAENTELAVKKGSKVIMSPATVAYLDMKYTPESRIGLDWNGHIEVDKSYNWKPDTITKVSEENILGVEAPLWTETVVTTDDIEYLAFPRIIGVAELGWSANKYLNLDSYKTRLANHAKRLEAKEINFYKSPVINWVE